MLPIKSLASFGFTLIELLVVIGIMGLVLAMGIPGYVKFQKNQALQQSGKELVAVLRLAQKRASVGDKPTGCSKLLGYKVEVTINSETYALKASCTGGTTVDISDYTLQSGVLFSATKTVTFNTVDSGIISGASISPAGPISLAYGSEYTYSVTVDNTGAVHEGSVQ